MSFLVQMLCLVHTSDCVFVWLVLNIYRLVFHRLPPIYQSKISYLYSYLVLKSMEIIFICQTFSVRHFVMTELADMYCRIMLFLQAKFTILYGVHHTKMAILRYNTGIRVMITTANLVPSDWFQKSQAMWCSPLCPTGKTVFVFSLLVWCTFVNWSCTQ